MINLFLNLKKEQEEQSTKEKNAYIEETRESLKTKVDKIPTESKQLKPKKKS
ncbi:hypothetical protein [Holzapfeliella floricola]|uniref:hypothetical protein n=1 Tax=Holzapfeliella floricola TaxID=679249 RepID=UPI000A7E48A7|nr:hypothetical protein [Holzapfeliella floricola]